MKREPRVRNPRPLVVPRHDEHRNATLGDTPERIERLVGCRRVNRRPIEHVATVDDEIYLSRERWLERLRVIREKVMAAPPPANPRLHRQVESDVRVR